MGLRDSCNVLPSSGGQNRQVAVCLCPAQLSQAGGMFILETPTSFSYLNEGKALAVDYQIYINYAVSLGSRTGAG